MLVKSFCVRKLKRSFARVNQRPVQSFNSSVKRWQLRESHKENQPEHPRCACNATWVAEKSHEEKQHYQRHRGKENHDEVVTDLLNFRLLGNLHLVIHWLAGISVDQAIYFVLASRRVGDYGQAGNEQADDDRCQQVEEAVQPSLLLVSSRMLDSNFFTLLFQFLQKTFQFFKY